MHTLYTYGAEVQSHCGCAVANILQIKLYEQRKSRATGLVDRLSSKCAELRRQIDEMRKDSISQHERFGTVRSAGSLKSPCSS